MKNYNKSDYALNKYSKNIVYRFSNSVVEVTPEQYLSENPDKTEEDFVKLKIISDSIYFQQDREECSQTYKNTSFYEKSSIFDFKSLPDEQYFELLEKLEAIKAYKVFIKDKTLTETQKRRFFLHYFKDMSFRKIAKLEGKSIRAIQQSVYAASDKLKKYFNFF